VGRGPAIGQVPPTASGLSRGPLAVGGPPPVPEDSLLSCLRGCGGTFQRSTVAIEKRDGILDQISEKGIVLSGARLSYSKWYEGDRPTDDLLGCKIRVVVDAGEKCTFLKQIVQVGEKSEGWTPPEPGKKGSFGGGGGRRFSPEELELKREEGVRIARSVAVDRAITMVRDGVSIEQIAPFAAA